MLTGWIVPDMAGTVWRAKIMPAFEKMSVVRIPNRLYLGLYG